MAQAGLIHKVNTLVTAAWFNPSGQIELSYTRSRGHAWAMVLLVAMSSHWHQLLAATTARKDHHTSANDG